jgi:hypothetical protein
LSAERVERGECMCGLFESGERGERRHTPHTQSEQITHTAQAYHPHTTHRQRTSRLTRGPCTGSAAPLLPPPKQPTNPHTHCVLMSVVWVVCVGVGVACGCLCVCVVARGLFVGCSWQPEDKKAGSSESDTYVLNNHLRFKIKYHPVDTDGVMTEGNPDGYPFFLFSPYFSLQDQVPPCRH